MNFKKYSLLIAVMTSIIAISACKENKVLDSNVVPNNGLIDVNAIPDTLTVWVKSALDDTAIGSAYTTQNIGIGGVGRITDSAFNTDMGITNSYLYFGVVSPIANYRIDTVNNYYDSVVLVLPYSGVTYGDTTNTAADLEYKVYRLNEPLDLETTYYTNRDFLAIQPELLGTAKVPVSKLSDYYKDSIIVNGKKELYHFRIPLAKSFMNLLIDKTNSSPEPSLIDFAKWINGFFITPDTNSTTARAIPFWNLTGFGTNPYDRAGIVVYGRSKAKPDSIVRDVFPFDKTSTTKFQKVDRRYPFGSLAQRLLSSRATSDSISFIQNEPGGTMDIKIPFVKNLPKGIINKAQIIITEHPSFVQPKLQTPTRLLPLRVMPNGSIESVQDGISSSGDASLAFMDGSRRYAFVNGILVSQYIINIPREFQSAIFEERDIHIRLNSAGLFLGAYRVVTTGRNSALSNASLKLNIVYSQLK